MVNLIYHFHPLRHSSESWNPVVYVIHSRPGGNDNKEGVRDGKAKSEAISFYTPAPLPGSFRWNRQSGNDDKAKQLRIRHFLSLSRHHSDLLWAGERETRIHGKPHLSFSPPSSFQRKRNPVNTIHSRPSGNDNKEGVRGGKAKSDGSEFHFTPRPRFLDSSFRWNDGRVAMTIRPNS